MSKASQLRERTVVAEQALKDKKGQQELVVDKNKVKAVYRRDIVSLEILKTPEKLKTVEEAEAYYDERVQHKMYLIDDLESNYMIRLSFTEKKKELSSVDPEHIPEIDGFELSESIQEILKENLFPVIKSNFPERPATEQATPINNIEDNNEPT